MTTDPAKIRDVHKCMDFLKISKNADISQDAFGEPLRQIPPLDLIFSGISCTSSRPWETSHNRNQVHQVELSVTEIRTLEVTAQHMPPFLLRLRSFTKAPIAGSRRVNHGGSLGSRPYPSTNLPVYINDFGRLPIHGQVNLPMPSLPQFALSTNTISPVPRTRLHI